jgi:hypothetical protein
MDADSPEPFEAAEPAGDSDTDLLRCILTAATMVGSSRDRVRFQFDVSREDAARLAGRAEALTRR